MLERVAPLGEEALGARVIFGLEPPVFTPPTGDGETAAGDANARPTD